MSDRSSGDGGGARRLSHLSARGAALGPTTSRARGKMTEIDVLSFGPNADPATIRRQRIASTNDLPGLPPEHTVRWVNVSGLGDAEVLNAVGERFQIHPLALEDIASTAQRPKVEPYSDCLFIVTRVPGGDGTDLRAAGAGVPASAPRPGRAFSRNRESPGFRRSAAPRQAG